MRGLGQIVTAVRPDIAFTNHSPGRGHGHHRASVLALRELMEQKFEQGWVVPVYQRDFNDAEAWQVKFPVELKENQAQSRGKKGNQVKIPVGIKEIK